MAWIDTSGPGEKPEYVASWPPAPKADEEDPVKLLAKLDELQLLPSPAKKETEEAADEESAKPAKESPAQAACATKKVEGE